MTYNNNNNMSVNNGSLGVPGSGFASRGKGAHIKRLSVPHPSKLDQRDDAVSTPRTSRSHLLAGLRTAPRQPSTPSTAPIHGMHNMGSNNNPGGYGNSYAGNNIPQTATATGFSHHARHHNGNGNGNGNSGYNGASSQNQQMYSLPEHILAPPAIDHILGDNGEPMDDGLYAELMSQNLFLAAQQQRLQQQLASVTAAAQQLQTLNLGNNMDAQQQVLSPSVSNMSYYQQQAQHGMQPVVQPIPGRPGLYSVFNPMTGQQNIVMDNSMQVPETPLSAFPSATQLNSPMDPPPTFRAEVSPPPESRHSPVNRQTSISPPSNRMPTPPRRSSPLSSSNNTNSQNGAMKRDHKKGLSVAVKFNNVNNNYNESGRAGTPKSAMFPPTPGTATFGPGQGRAGEHPMRQPRGPPPLEELTSKPTSKCEGSKNFVTRQRRQAIHSLVRARMERRAEPRDSGHSSSGGNVTPSSETDFALSGSDGDDSGTGTANTSLSGKPSLGSLRAAANGAIGSERKGKDLAFRNKTGSSGPLYSSVSANADHEAGQQGRLPQRRKMPMLVLSSAEKRKNSNG